MAELKAQIEAQKLELQNNKLEQARQAENQETMMQHQREVADLRLEAGLANQKAQMYAAENQSADKRESHRDAFMLEAQKTISNVVHLASRQAIAEKRHAVSVQSADDKVRVATNPYRVHVQGLSGSPPPGASKKFLQNEPHLEQ